MAVFKEKNGALKAAGYLRGRTISQIQPGLLTFDQDNSPHPQVVRDSRHDSANERNVRTAMTAFDGLSGKEVPGERKS